MAETRRKFRDTLVERANEAKRNAEAVRRSADLKAHEAEVAEAAYYALADAIQLYDNAGGTPE